MGAPSTTFRQTQRKKPPEGGFGGPGRNRTTALGGLILLQDCPFEGQFSLAR